MKFLWLACVLAQIVVLDGDDRPLKIRCFRDSIQEGVQKATEEIFIRRQEIAHIEVDTKHNLTFGINGGNGDMRRYRFGCTMKTGKCRVQLKHGFNPYSYSDLIELDDGMGSSLQYRFKEQTPPSKCTPEEKEEVEQGNPNVVCYKDSNGVPHKRCVEGKAGKDCENDVLSEKTRMRRSASTFREIECSTSDPATPAATAQAKKSVTSDSNVPPEELTKLNSIVFMAVLFGCATGFYFACYKPAKNPEPAKVWV